MHKILVTCGRGFENHVVEEIKEKLTFVSDINIINEGKVSFAFDKKHLHLLAVKGESAEGLDASFLCHLNKLYQLKMVERVMLLLHYQDWASTTVTDNIHEVLVNICDSVDWTEVTHVVRGLRQAYEPQPTIPCTCLVSYAHAEKANEARPEKMLPRPLNHKLPMFQDNKALNSISVMSTSEGKSFSDVTAFESDTQLSPDVISNSNESMQLVDSSMLPVAEQCTSKISGSLDNRSLNSMNRSTKQGSAALSKRAKKRKQRSKCTLLHNQCSAKQSNHVSLAKDNSDSTVLSPVESLFPSHCSNCIFRKKRKVSATDFGSTESSHLPNISSHGERCQELCRNNLEIQNTSDGIEGMDTKDCSRNNEVTVNPCFSDAILFRASCRLTGKWKKLSKLMCTNRHSEINVNDTDNTSINSKISNTSTFNLSNERPHEMKFFLETGKEKLNNVEYFIENTSSMHIAGVETNTSMELQDCMECKLSKVSGNNTNSCTKACNSLNIDGSLVTENCNTCLEKCKSMKIVKCDEPSGGVESSLKTSSEQPFTHREELSVSSIIQINTENSAHDDTDKNCRLEDESTKGMDSDILDLLPSQVVHKTEQQQQQQHEQQHEQEQERQPQGRNSLLSELVSAVLQHNTSSKSWKLCWHRPQVDIYLNITDLHALLGISLSRKPLSLRPYIPHLNLRSTVCHLMLRLALQPYLPTSTKTNMSSSSLAPLCTITVLDPMCGAATILAEAAHSFKVGHVIGCDVSEQQLRLARCNLSTLTATASTLLAVDAAKLPLASGSVDCVVCDYPFGQQHQPYQQQRWRQKQQLNIAAPSSSTLATDSSGSSSVQGDDCLLFTVLDQCARVVAADGRVVLLVSAAMEPLIMQYVAAAAQSKGRGVPLLRLESRHSVALGTTSGLLCVLLSSPQRPIQ